MKARLTLRINKAVIDNAKIYTKEHKHNLSFLVENYLRKITTDKQALQSDEIEISSLVKAFTLADGKVPEDFNYKKARFEYLIKKYK
ncbi:DUF6364 family protein [Flavobacterium pectinovorum]|uniref:DUF6364 family protein n=1 Tax=Flavobacterium TaxID=237 RepID=UPI0005AD0E00|nr:MULTISPECIES: DUF6364 family protein [Flavobacterium]KIQ19468.1 hypothetical protein RT99_15155 [Flavobacterium sp. MEB061]WKL46319.1 DUF6364 family protein [Flavobacterium pectinovorum]